MVRGKRFHCRMIKKATNYNKDDTVLVDVLCNLKQNLQCCVVAFEGADCLYQTIFTSDDGKELGIDEINVQFWKVNDCGDTFSDPITLSEIPNSSAVVSSPINLSEIPSSSDVVSRPIDLSEIPNSSDVVSSPIALSTIHDDQTGTAKLPLGTKRVVGINGNKRIVRLKQVVDTTPDDELMSEPLHAYIGSKQATRLFDESEIERHLPQTFDNLNDEQKAVANPITLKNAMECAGPPGTGKTKTIVEMIRSILHCTDLEVIVLSERNGAIDAIAEMLAHDCLDIVDTSSNNNVKIKDMILWYEILAVGSAGMGSFARRFKLDEKVKYAASVLKQFTCTIAFVYVISHFLFDRLQNPSRSC
jgi:AAA domain